jgi:Protein of Unknown function (DUF2784)
LFYGILADVLVAIHLAIVAFVVLGLVAILIGVALKRSWARNFWFRLVHLFAIGFIAVEGLVGADCPLTIWEQQLRDAAHQGFSGDSFMSRLIHNVLFIDVDPNILNRCHIAFGVLVLSTFIVAPPRWRRPKGAVDETKGATVEAQSAKSEKRRVG